MAPARKRLVLLVKLALAAGAIFFLLRSGRLDADMLAQAARPANLPYLLVAGCAFLLAQVVAARRLVLLLGTIDFNLTFLQSFKLTMVGNFFNVVIPGSFGGDVVKAAWLFRGEHAEKGRSTGVLMMDRFLGLLGISVLGLLSLAYTLHHDQSLFGHYRRELSIVFAAILSMVGAFAVFLVLGRNGAARSLARRIAGAVFSQGVLYRVAGGVGLTVRACAILLQAFVLSILTHLCAVVGILALYRMTGQGAAVIDLVAASSVVFLVSAVPLTPGNVGWTELMASLIWAAVGSSAGAEVFLMWRMVSVVCSLPGAAFLVGMRSAEKGSLPTADARPPLQLTPSVVASNESS